ncbi:hypothetical protein CBS101457_006235 [Exobasidium rhododendri]|nr:hypothetical protein CBS101457_006235 [Exobasidium rhododendri]
MAVNATESAKEGPWTVVNAVTASPNHDSQAYVSFARYFWANCCEDIAERNRRLPPDATPHFSPSKRASQLEINTWTIEPKGWQDESRLIWTTCPYISIDGFSNPDIYRVKGPNSWLQMSLGAILQAVSYALTGDDRYAEQAVDLLHAFFLDQQTGVRPTFDFAQTVRGPPGGTGEYSENDFRIGTYRGVIDTRRILVVANAILILRKGGTKLWTHEYDVRMMDWARSFLQWLETSPIALKAKGMGNNISSYYYNQVISLNILLNDQQIAVELLQEYFNGPFLTQIDTNGLQTREAKRIRKLHYVSFALEGMIANAKIADHLGLNMWNAKTESGTTIRDAIDYAVKAGEELKASSRGDEGEGRYDFAELAPHIATALAVYGDHPDHRYQNYLNNATLTMDKGGDRSWRFFNLPCNFKATPLMGNH